MTHAPLITVAALSALASGGNAIASITVSPSFGVTTEFVNGEYEITIRSNPNGPITYEIDGSASDRIRIIEIQHTGTTQTDALIDVYRLEINGVAAVEEIDRSQGTARIWLQNSVFGDLGADQNDRVQAWEITDVVITGT